MKNLSSRVISALTALVLLILAVYFGREKGIYLICLLVVIRGSFEITRLFFGAEYPKFTKRLYVFLASAIFIIITQESLRFLTGLLVILTFVFIVLLGIVFHKSFSDINLILSFVAKFCMGLIYTCFIPAMVVWTLQTNYGIEWFFCLLVVVFAGDIGAFIFGSKFGKTKIAPALSPNKSLQGSLGGLLFSTLAAVAFQFVLPNTPILVLILCGFLGGMLGQIGDFYESLIKRIAGVKDSGSIMPGHGGILDRLDGVLMASPLFYIAATYFSL